MEFSRELGAYNSKRLGREISFRTILKAVIGYLRNTLYTSTCFYRLNLYVNDLVN